MEDSALSVEVTHDFLPEWNRMLGLPDEDNLDEVVKWLARGTRLRLWRSGPRKVAELRPAAEAEIAEAVEAGMVAADNAADFIDRLCLILASDTSIADPPCRDEVEYILESMRGRWHGIYCAVDTPGRMGAPIPVGRDRYGNWPGARWQEAVDWAMARVCQYGTSTSSRIAYRILRDEVTRDAEAVAAREAAERQERTDLAVASLPAVFEGDQQGLLSFVRRLNAGGDFVEVPTDGNPVAEAELLRQVRAHDIYGMTPAQQADVATELMRIIATTETAAESPLIVPGLGYAIKVEGKKIVDVFPGNLTLTIEGREHVLNSPELPRPVRMSAKVFRDSRLCALAIYEQVLVEVDNPRGHWRKWWPVLAERLRKTSRVVQDADRITEWRRFVAGVIAAAPQLSHTPSDGGPYWCTEGRFFVGKEWLISNALSNGVIGLADRKAFSDWLGTAYKNRRDAEGGQHKRLEIEKNSPLCIEGTFEPVEKSEIAGSSGTKVP